MRTFLIIAATVGLTGCYSFGLPGHSDRLPTDDLYFPDPINFPGYVCGKAYDPRVDQNGLGWDALYDCYQL